jgi:hypothetical protein
VSKELAGPLEVAQQMAGSGSRVRLKIVDGRMSPAVCGLFNPSILLPRMLVEKLSAGQLRAVLLHELFHLRRKDVWVNCAQALLQIFYWWHPLLWLANARIRRVREEAVDDAVMLALRDEAEDYAPTLLEVAKLAFRRPRTSLGLVGIMESRSALRQRIERLVNFRTPRKAGLTFLSVFGVLVFSAVALPMGEAPGPAEKETTTVPAVSMPSVPVPKASLPSVLVAAEFYQMREEDFRNLVSGLSFNQGRISEDSWWLASPEKFSKLQNDLKQSHFNPLIRPRVQTSSGIPARMYMGDGTNGLWFDCTPVVKGGKIDLAVYGQVIAAGQNMISTNQFHVATLAESSGGMVFRLERVDGLTASNLVGVIGVQFVTNLVAGGNPPTNSTAKDSRAMTFKLDHPIRQDELKEKLLAAGVKIPTTAYFYTDSGIILVRGSEEQLARVNRLVLKLNGYSTNVIEADSNNFIQRARAHAMADEASTNLLTRTFRVGAYAFTGASRNIPDLQTNSVSATARSLFSKLGVDWESPKGKSVFYNDGLGLLFVKATESDLDTIERAFSALNYTAPQIHIKARFLEVPNGTLAGFTKTIGITNSPEQLVGILTSENAKTLMRTLQSRSGVEELAEPEVTTLSGRETEMRATQIITVITNFAYRETSTNSYVFPQTNAVETGPILDTIPNVLSDGYTIDLKTTASLTEFLGYDKTTNTIAAYNSAGEKIDLPTILPNLRVWQASAHVKVWDGQTVVLERPEDHFLPSGNKPGANSKALLVFITVTLVDPAGNRIHSGDDMQFAKDAIPQQDGP